MDPVALIVQKYGGTSVADPDRMRAVAENVAFTRRHGNDVVVVPSAMGKTTDNLIKLANDVSKTQPGREMDMLITTGERISMSLLCMALADLGIEAVSFTGSQAGIITDSAHGKAKIVEVKGDRIREGLAAGKVCVVAGFQGISIGKEITSLGRGGSDTTAVALAASLRADSCEIYTDVTGVFSADPRIVPQARKLAHINFDEMLEMAGAGSKVLALRSVEFARNHNVPIHVRSAFTWEPGTWVTDQEPSMEEPIISGVVTDTSESKVTIVAVPDRPGISAALFEPLAAANVNVDMIVQNTSQDGTTDISFTMPKADMATAESIVSRVAAEIGVQGCRSRRRHRQDQPGRRRHEDQPRHRRQDVPHARRRVGQHRDDLDLDHPHQRGHRRPATSSAPPAHCTPRSGSIPARRTPRRCRNGSSQRPMRRNHVPWRAAGTTTELKRSADEVVRETGWVFNNVTGSDLSLAEFVETGNHETLAYLTAFGLDDQLASQTLVEIGAGIGRMTASFTRLFGRVVACDLDAAFLERCRETVAQFGRPERLQTSRVADGRTIALPDRNCRPDVQLHHVAALPSRRCAGVESPKPCASPVAEVMWR